MFYLSIDSVWFLPPAVQQRPSFVLDVTDVNVIPIVFTKWDPCAAKHQQIVSVQHGWKDKSQSGGQPNGILTAM